MLSELLALLKSESLKAGGLTFARFMQLALYSPWGYYNQAVRIGTKDADFYTAAQLPLFVLTLVRCMVQIWEQWGGPDTLQIVEFGAGQGELAEQAGRALLRSLPDWTRIRYVIVETAEGLAIRQQERLNSLVAERSGRLSVVWGQPDAALDSIVIANELLDALPVERVRRVRDGWQQGFVEANKDNQLRLVWEQADPVIADAANLWTPIPVDSEAEVCTEYDSIFTKCVNVGRRVEALFFDYGITREEWRSGARPRGTLRGYKRHQVVDVLSNPGEVDITADVNWDHTMDAAKRAGFRDCTLWSQGQFLMNCDILGVLTEMQNECAEHWGAEAPKGARALTNQFKQLVLPGGMGERFSVMACTVV